MMKKCNKAARLSLLLLSAAFLFSCATSDTAESMPVTETPYVPGVMTAEFTENTSSKGQDDASSGNAAARQEVTPAQDVTETAPAPAEVPLQSAVKLPGLSQKAVPFSRLDPAVVEAARKGSASSIKEAAAKLHKNSDSEYTDDERVMLAMLSAMLTYAYPSDKTVIQVPSDLPENTYTGIVDSLKAGIYDTNAGTVDFFTLVMPSLILVSSPKKDGFLDEAEESLVMAIAIDDGSVLAHYLLGVLYSRKGEYQKAATELKRASVLDASCQEISLAAADAYIKAGWTDDAVSETRMLLVMNPGSLPVLKLCAEAAFAANDIESAENYVAQVLQKEPNNLDYILLRARILFAKGEYLKVSSLLDVYGRTNRTDLDYLLLRTQLQLKWNKNTTSASVTIQEALSLYPESTEALLYAAEIALETGSRINGMTADELIAPVYGKEPENQRVLRILVASAEARQDWESAYETSSVLIKGDSSMDVLLQHVELCLKLGLSSEAAEICGALYDSFPGDESVQQSYIRVLIATGATAEASELITSLLPAAQTKMKSSLYYEKSRLESDETQKLADLRSSLTANPRNQDALYALYELYYGKSDWRKAQYYIKQVIALKPSDERLKALNAELDALLSR